MSSEINKKYYLKHKKQIQAYKKRYQIEHYDTIRAGRKIRQDIFSQYKETGCAICGYNKCVAALDFHHVNQKLKKFRVCVSTMNRKGFIEEFHKCILVCKNCHYELHHIEG